MNTLNSTHNSNDLRATIPLSRRHALFGLMAASLSLHGCGGGGGSSSAPGGNSASSFTTGIITGLGSIIVNGVRYDDSSANISDDDGVSLSSSDLRIGMVVSVASSLVTTINGSSSAIANRISSQGTELKGPVDSVGASSFVVLGQTVNVNTSTIYAPSLTGLASLRAGDLVEVHGFTDAQANTVTASLIERKANLNQYRLSGKVSNLDTTAKTFSIGSLQINYATADLRTTLANGSVVRVRLATTPASGIRTALRIQKPEANLSSQDNFSSSEIHGIITAFTSLASFSVNGLPVVTNGSTAYPRGSAGLVLGARVEIKGSVSAGIFTASIVKLEDNSDLEAIENEVNGVISAFNATAKTFVVRGITVDYSSNAITYLNGTASNLANGRLVQVRGLISAATSQLLPNRIKFES